MDSSRDMRCQEVFDCLGEVRNVLLVVLTLIAAVTFQAGVKPPGAFGRTECPDISRGVQYMLLKIRHLTSS